MDASEVLVRILAAALAVLLTVSIVFMIYLVKLVIQLRKITEKAEQVADNVEAASSFFRQSAAPIAISKFFANIIEAVGDKSSKKKGKK